MAQTTHDTMHAAAIDTFGGPVTLHTLPVPEMGPDEVLVHIQSAGVGVWDPFEREGGFAKAFGVKPHFPYVLGSEGAGTVVDVGTRVRNFKKGDRAYAVAIPIPRAGFYAEYAAVKESDAAPVPDTLSVEQAGVMPVVAITALRGLDDMLKLKRGESVMIFGASGGIGHLAVQFAKHMGARVFAAASGDDGVALVKRLGADAVVDGHRDDVRAAARRFAPDGLDAALVTAGGEVTDRALEAVRDGGRVAYPNGVEPEPKARPGIAIKSYESDVTPEMMAKLHRLITEAPIEVHVDRTLPLDRADEALQALDRHFLGKLALRPS
ncbi:MAG TPA: NADP-dependent oxidoreductase [Gemmatimonadaceae bacterium]|nr:NADP-dependent oxidoreductase [Gemmatimonadaceae bacterium]